MARQYVCARLGLADAAACRALQRLDSGALPVSHPRISSLCITSLRRDE